MRLTKKRLENLKILHELEKQNNSSKIPEKSVSKPNAQTTKLCEPSDIRQYDFIWSETIYQRLSKISSELANLFAFQYDTAVRISEALEIKCSQIKMDGSVFIKSKKGSFEGIVNSSRTTSYLIECKKNNRNPFETYNRFFIYRIYKNLGVTFQSQLSKKVSVTHALRHIKVQNLINGGIESEEITKILRHKNPKNTELYGKQKPKRTHSTNRKHNKNN